MTAKEYKKALVAARREANHQYGFHQSAFINYMEKAGYFFCIYFFPEKAVLTVKPIYADDLWWEIWHTPNNMNHSRSLRGRGIYSVPAQTLTSYILPDRHSSCSFECLCAKIDSIFRKAIDEIDRFLIDNPFPANFYPDESKMMHDPDRLLYLMALIRNMRYDEALEIIDTAKRNVHKCAFKNGPFIDSYTYIKCYCKNRNLIPKILDTLFRHDYIYKYATQTYKNANAYLKQNPYFDTPWYQNIPTWCISIIILIILFAIIVPTAFASAAVGYKTLYLTPKWVWGIGSLTCVLIALLIFSIRFRNPFKDIGALMFFLPISIVSGMIGYFITDIGITWFYAVNYWHRGPQQFTTIAVVTDDKWEYETHEGRGKTRVHYVNVLDLPDEHRKIKAVDGYIHCFPTDTEFDLVYSKGFFGIDVFEDAINIRYPSED
ncbi:MAG: hypothetical protein K2K98_14345 [Muribaculaceae bacterium]|nr:hypothetical protein [Muribaculaceae bacterium]